MLSFRTLTGWPRHWTPRSRPGLRRTCWWNIRAFGGLTPEWVAGPGDSPKRDWAAVGCIAEIVSRFDVIALQEVRRSTKALRFLLERLGPAWRVIASDVTEGSAGNAERLAFLYNADRVQASGLVGEIVLPPMGTDPALEFARSPYFAGFTRAGTEFTLASVHVLWGKNAAERLPEVTAFAQWMRAWADRDNDWNHNLMVLGDFNLDRIGDPLGGPPLETKTSGMVGGGTKHRCPCGEPYKPEATSYPRLDSARLSPDEHLLPRDCLISLAPRLYVRTN